MPPAHGQPACWPSTTLQARGELQREGLERVLRRHVGVYLALLDVEAPAMEAQPAAGHPLLDPGECQKIGERGLDRFLLEDAQLVLEWPIAGDEQGAPARLGGDLQPAVEEAVLVERRISGQESLDAAQSTCPNTMMCSTPSALTPYSSAALMPCCA